MLIQNCKHQWKKHTDASRQQDVGSIDATFICDNCHTILTASEAFQLESLENQNKTLEHIKGFESKMAILALVVSMLALVISLFKR